MKEIRKNWSKARQGKARDVGKTRQLIKRKEREEKEMRENWSKARQGKERVRRG